MPKLRSTLPLACGEYAAIHPIPNSLSPRPNCVKRSARKVKILERAETMGDGPTRSERLGKTLRTNSGPCNVVLPRFRMFSLGQRVQPSTMIGFKQIEFFDHTGSLGFNGGLLFEPGNGLFYAISNDVNGASELNSFSLGGGAGSLILLFSLGSGFNNVGLTEIPAVPEPATGLSFVTAVAALAALCRMRRCSDACPACGEVPKHRGKCSVCGLNNHAPRGCFVSSGFAPFLAERQGDSSPTYQMVTDCGAQEAGVAGETDRTSRAAACSPQR